MIALGFSFAFKLQAQVNGIQVSDQVRNYIISLVHATRESDLTALGVSPRGSLALCAAARATALVRAARRRCACGPRSRAGWP